jgi:hypothetical protein
MMAILTWDKPAKVMSQAEYERILADGAPPGVYTPNMSPADMGKWKAKFVGGKSGDPRVEIRKSTTMGVQLLIVVRPKTVRMSMNGTAELTADEMDDMYLALNEAQRFLMNRAEAQD